MKYFLPHTIKLFQYYKLLGEKTFDQVPADKLFWRPNKESNSMAIIVQHLSGNMLSRWTDFLKTDGEKNWRMRDKEFEVVIKDKEEFYKIWEKGWSCLFDALSKLKEEDLIKTVYIRNKTIAR